MFQKVARLLLVAFVSVFGIRANGQYQVPREYQPLYLELLSKLTKFDNALNTVKTPQINNVVGGAELLTANSHGGPELLTIERRIGNLAQLTYLQKMGVKGVTLAINYPMFDRKFHALPGVGSFEEYLDFYKWIAYEARKRNLKVIVETGPIFPPSGECVYSAFPVDLKAFYSSMTPADYIKGRISTAEVITAELKPDYLQFGAEFDVEEELTGHPIGGVTVSTQVVSLAADAVKRIKTAFNIKTLFGAGIGSWNQNHKSLVQNYLNLKKLDFIDLHIYPINLNFLSNAMEIATLVRAAGVRLTIMEVGLNKISDKDVLSGEASAVASAEVFARGTFQFWEPLDMIFIGTIMKFSRIFGIDYVSPYWTNYFSAYLDYSKHGALSTCELLNQVQAEAGQAILEGRPATSYGLTYALWIK